MRRERAPSSLASASLARSVVLVPITSKRLLRRLRLSRSLWTPPFLSSFSGAPECDYTVTLPNKATSFCILFKNIKWLKRFKWKKQFSEWCTYILKCDCRCVCIKRDKKKHWNWYKLNLMKSDLTLICYWKYKIQAKCQRPRYRSLTSKDIIYLVNPGSVRSGPPRELSA